MNVCITKMFPSALFLCLFLLSLVSLSIIGKSIYKRNKIPPSPPRLPFIGNLHQVTSLTLRSLRDLSTKHGPLMLLQLGNVRMLVVSSADMAQEVLKNHDEIFASRPSVKTDNVLGYGAKNVAFAPYGDYWKSARKLYVAHLLGLEKVRSLEKAREEEVHWVLEEIRRAQRMSQSVDLTEAFSLFAMGILGRSASKTFSERHLMLKVVEEGSSLYFNFNFEDYFPTLRYLDRFLNFESKLRNVSRRVDALFEEIINRHIYEPIDDIEKDRDFIGALLSLQANRVDGEFEITKEHMKAFLWDLVAAGLHTTFRTLEWAMAELIRDPKTMKQTQDEVRKIALNGKELIRYEDLKGAATLKAVIKETLRLHPPGPVAVPHESIQETQINGYTIPKGTRVLVNIWSINRDPKYWENPDEFHPQRFIKNDVSFFGNNFHFIPFGAGRRICPGINFAMYNIEVLLANILYHFDWELPSGMKTEDLDMGYAPALTVLRNKRLHLVPK